MDKDKKKELLSNFAKLSNELAKDYERPYYQKFNLRGKTLGYGEQYTDDKISSMIKNLDVDSMRQVSRFFYQTSASYRRMIDHFAGMFLYYYHLSLNNTQDDQKTSILQKYNKALTLLDNLCDGGTLKDITTEVLVSGIYFGYVNNFKGSHAVLTTLDPSYCQARFKSPYNTDIVEFNVTYFDTISDEAERQEILSRMPEELQLHYLRWKRGAVSTYWFPFSPHAACAFYLDSSDGEHAPPIFDTIVDIINYEDEKELEKDKDKQQLERILVERFELDEDADLQMFLEELAKIHEGVAAMLQDNKYVDVLTTIADEVKMLDSRSSDTNSATNNNIIKMMLPKYENAGLSSEIFYSTTATALNLSILNATSFVGKLNEKYANWLTVFLLGNITFGKIHPTVEILPVTWYNKDKMVDSYLQAAQSGYSKIMPYIANGGKQSTLLSSLELENEILELDEKLIPLSTSYTLSNKDKVGNAKPDDEKTEETVRTTDARGEDRNANTN